MPCRAGKAVRNLTGVVDAPVIIHPLAHPQHVFVRTLVARFAQHRSKTAALGIGRVFQQVDEHQRAFSLADVAVKLLPVRVRVTLQVEQIVLDLKRCAQENPK